MILEAYCDKLKTGLLCDESPNAGWLQEMLEIWLLLCLVDCHSQVCVSFEVHLITTI